MPDRPVKTFASLEEAALDALADEEDEDLCEECGEPGTEDGTYCYSCKVGLSDAEAVGCPFCTLPPRACAHRVLVVDAEAGWIEVPIDEDDLPWLEDDGASAAAWADGEIEAVFGELGPLAQTYDTPRSLSHILEFYECLAGRMTTPVVMRDGINAMAVYSEYHRDEARTEIEAIVQKLAEGFERLAARRRMPEDAKDQPQVGR